MRGTYLGLVASLEMNLTFLLAEWLKVGNHQEEFHDWFMEAPIPFRSKIRLYEALTKSGGLTEQFGDMNYGYEPAVFLAAQVKGGRSEYRNDVRENNWHDVRLTSG